ncbi:tannase/feruloyl esterase family alpha/beta hydrolase [Nostoc sp. 3335mG]|nr:tannase/feruloyl esterase family alpha/beta hydrolase [Nostoc sp. 3335mG]
MDWTWLRRRKPDTRFLLAAIVALGTCGTAHAEGCADLVKLPLPHGTIRSAVATPAGEFVEERGKRSPIHYPDVPTFCRVSGISSPVPGSKIGFEVWLPLAEAWSQRLHMVGNGAYGSNLYYAQLVARVQRGDVGVATDTGHDGSSLLFGRDNPVAIEDWGNRAVHETVVAAKRIVKAYYGRPQRWSYFSGSSTGGHEALMAAQRHPEDFDGIIAGAPGNNRTNLNLEFLWEYLHNHRPGDDAHQIVPNAKLAMLNAAVIRACDGIDGVKDGVINDPRACHFKVASLACKGAETPDCLTPEQVATIKAIYAGPRDARTGAQIYPGFPFGSEGMGAPEDPMPGWSEFWADPDMPTAPQRADFFRHWVFHDPAWNWWTFDWGKDVDTVHRVMAPVINATDPDLSRFRARGGKLIMFIGWGDPVGSAFEAINYYDSVVARSKASADKLGDTQRFARLYMVPGMGHTSGGPGAVNFSNATRDSAPPVEDSRHDMGLALYDWVEKGIAPNDIVATHFSKGSGPKGVVAFQRPLCVYPRVARYKGGNDADAASYRCQSPAGR